MQLEQSPKSPLVPEESQHLPIRTGTQKVMDWLDRRASSFLIMPAVLAILFLSLFPLLVSLYLSLSRFKFVPGGFQFTFVGLANYRKLLFGSERNHFLGVLGQFPWWAWAIFNFIVVLLLLPWIQKVRSRKTSIRELIGNLVLVALISGLIYLVLRTLAPSGRPGTMVVTILYVFIGATIQYTLGLILALLATQKIPGRRFFRVVYLIPMMITPVGIAYIFRMLVDTDKGPFQPIWQALGLGLFSWVNEPWGARAAVMIGDIWQWTPFMFIVLLAALEGQSVELLEAARVDGANRWQAFWHITFPQILPVSTTLFLIRMIEAFKIVDLPYVLTNGGPGTATESMTLQAYISWRSLDLGGSAAIAYLLLFLVTFLGTAFVSLIRSRLAEV